MNQAPSPTQVKEEAPKEESPVVVPLEDVGENK